MRAHEIVEAYDSLRKEYDLYKSEAHACGYEVESFEEWSGAESAKAKAQDRLQRIIDRDEWDLY